MVTKVAIVGYGWVGRSVHKLFPQAVTYDIILPDSSRELVNGCDVAFVAVPTPCVNRGALDVSAVEEVVSWCGCPLIIVRSTVNPGTCDFLAQKYGRRIVMMPEYLGETVAHPMLDPAGRKFLVIGGAPADRRAAIDLYATAYNANVSIRQVTAYEAEVIKLAENRAIAFKVAQCQELYDACGSAGAPSSTTMTSVWPSMCSRISCTVRLRNISLRLGISTLRSISHSSPISPA